MKIVRFDIKRFGRFEDHTIQLNAGFNAIIGTNESGKTTIAEALCVALFDDPARPSNTERQKNWRNGHPYLLHLEYQCDGKTYRLTKDVSTELSLLEEVETGSRWNTYKAVQEQIQKALGFSERDFFEATSCMLQGRLEYVYQSGNLIKDKLERLLNSNKDEVLASRVLDKIASRVSELEGSDGTGGLIGGMVRKVAGWENELLTCKSKTAELLETRKRVHSNATELAETQSKFDEMHERFRKSKQAFEAAETLEKEKEVYLDLSRKTHEAQEIKAQTSAKKETLKSLTKIERGDVKTCEGLATQRTIYEGKVQDLEGRLERDRETVEQAIPRGWYKYMLGVGLAAAAGCLFAYSSTKDALLLAATGTALLVTVTSVILWFGSRRTHASALAKFHETKARLEEERETLKKNSDTLDALLRRFRVKDVDELGERYEQYRDLDRDIKTLVARYETILGENNLKDLELDLAKLNEKMDEQSRVFEQFRAYTVSGAELERLQREVSELDKKLGRLREESTSLGNKLQFIESGTDIMAPLQERIEEGTRHLQLMRAEVDQLRIVARYLEESRRKVLKSSMESLEEEASSNLSALTAGTWSHVRLDRHTLQCEISNDNAEWFNARENLSLSARDSLSMALRLALIRVLSGDRRVPLILDDPFVNLDRVRRVEAERLLRGFSEEYQIIMLSSDEHYREIADQGLSLTTDARSNVGLSA